MKRNALVIVLAGVAVAVAAWQFVPAGTRATANPTPATTASTPNVPHPVSATTDPIAVAGYVVHLDEIGNVVTTPATVSDAEFNRQLEQTLNTSASGLVEKASPIPGGGVGLDLQGRFQAAMTATTDANGKVVVPCLTNAADANAFTTPTPADKAAGKE